MFYWIWVLSLRLGIWVFLTDSGLFCSGAGDFSGHFLMDSGLLQCRGFVTIFRLEIVEFLNCRNLTWEVRWEEECVIKDE